MNEFYAIIRTNGVKKKATRDENLALLVQRVATLLGAERCTLFLRDPSTGELVSKVRTGFGRLEIRVPASAGLIGACISGAEIVNVADAYQDPRFNRQVDERTGIRTRCVLCCPVVKNGEVIGVLEAINKD